MNLRLITIGEVDAGTASTGSWVLMLPGGPINVVATSTGTGTYDESVKLEGSIDGTAACDLGDFTAEGNRVSLDEPWQYLRVRQATGTGTAGAQLTLKALLLMD